MRYLKRFNKYFINEADTAAVTTTQPNQTIITQQSTPTEVTDNKKEDIKPTGKLTNEEEMALQAELNKWSEQYADKFKFKNAEPRMVTDNVVDTILPENQSAVSAAIDSIIQILSQDKYKGRVKNISVIGHTSSTWGKATTQVAATNNQKLSEVRAMSVTKTIQIKAQQALAGIKFEAIGKGLTELIIKNDANEGAAEAGEGSKQLTSFPFADLTDPEQKQAINRRVVITLPNFKPKYAPKEEKPATPPPTIVVEKPIAPKPTSIEFNYDSYIPTKNSNRLIVEFANNIVAWNKQKSDKIKDVYICSHSNKATNKDKSDEKRQDKVIFIISLNRALAIKKVMSLIAKDVNFHVIPASYYVTKTDDPTRNKKVELEFEVNDKVKAAKEAYAKLSQLYNVENNNNEYPSDNILLNKGLRDDIIKDVKQYTKAQKADRFIPLELWDSKLGKYEEGLEDFKKRILSLAGGNEDVVKSYLYTPLT
jgi:outer membrane protein OmpA-like peptidoglycan-associated protein